MIILPTIMVPVPPCQLVHISCFTVNSPFYLLQSLIGTVPGPSLNLTGPIHAFVKLFIVFISFTFTFTSSYN